MFIKPFCPMYDHGVGAVFNGNAFLNISNRKYGILFPLNMYGIWRWNFLVPIHDLINGPINISFIPHGKIFFIQMQPFGHRFAKSILCQKLHVVYQSRREQFVHLGIFCKLHSFGKLVLAFTEDTTTIFLD